MEADHCWIPTEPSCRLKIAEFSAEVGKYIKAVEIYEEAAKRAVENNLLKFSARGYLLNAGQGPTPMQAWCMCHASCLHLWAVGQPSSSSAAPKELAEALHARCILDITQIGRAHV